MTPGQLYLETAMASFRSLKEMGEGTFRQLAPADFHWQPDPTPITWARSCTWRNT